MHAGGRDIANWSVVFYGKPRNAVERLWFKPGFRHCIAFAWLDTDRWLEIQPSFFRQRMRILTGPQYARRLVAIERIGGRTVKAGALGGVRRIPRIATCAGTLAHVLGVRGALLPHGLYRALLADHSQAGETPPDVAPARHGDLHASQ